MAGSASAAAGAGGGSKDDALKAAVQFTVSEICAEREAKLKMQTTKGFQFVVAELVWNFAEQLGGDLEAFAQHARRSQVNVEVRRGACP